MDVKLHNKNTKFFIKGVNIMKVKITKKVLIVCFLLLSGIVVGLIIAGCATIMHGSGQSIGISSHPSGASVFIDNVPYGNTPVSANLSRRDEHTVRIELKGYAPYEMQITKRTSAWVFGNIVFGGLIGLAVDAISGGLYELTPSHIRALFDKQGMNYPNRKDVIYVSLVSSPDPSWRKIGNLVPEIKQ